MTRFPSLRFASAIAVVAGAALLALLLIHAGAHVALVHHPGR
jgi:hypothetical protein